MHTVLVKPGWAPTFSTSSSAGVYANSESPVAFASSDSSSEAAPDLPTGQVSRAPTPKIGPKTFADLGVPLDLIERLRNIGIHKPSGTQVAALPALLRREHAVLKAETGSGKTLCYLIPILETLLQKIAAHDGKDQMHAVGLVVVPTAELAKQVCAVAHLLMPGHEQLIRAVHGTMGVARRQNCGLIIGTPRGISENVHGAHLKHLLYVVLDEADALLSGDLKADTVKTVLSPFKMVMPDDRPMHIFCAATLPSRGQTSVMGFLDKYYPAETAVRIETAGSHRALPNVRQTFVHLDAAVPLTQFEIEQRQRLSDKISKSAQVIREMGSEAAGDSGVTSAAVDAEHAGAEAANGSSGVPVPHDNAEDDAAAVDEDEIDDLGADGDADVATAHAPRQDDRIQRVMKGRIAEDVLQSMRADEKRYLLKVESLRKEAVIEALLAPAKWLGKSPSVLDAKSASAASGASLPSDQASDRTGAAAAASANSGEKTKKEKVRPSAVLGFLTDQRPPNPRSERGKARKEKEAARPSITIETLAEGSATSGSAIDALSNAASRISTDAFDADSAGADLAPRVPPQLVPLSLPEEARPRLTPAECELVPPTLIFVNSAGAADTLRKHIAERCPSIRITAVHGDVPDAARVARLADFAEGRVRVLICTNLTARGLDTTHVAHVIQAEFASDAVSHLHRIGRTARAGKGGMVTSLVTRSNLDMVEVLMEAQVKGDPLDSAFSAKRSFRRRVKRGAIAAAEDALLDAAIDAKASS